MAGGYLETNKYKDTQPLDARKKGFGSKDASRRDEFANSIRTEQYREGMVKEKFLMSQNSEKLKEDLTRLLAQRTITESRASTTNGFSYSQKVSQYDIGRTRITPFDPKSSKDRFYQFDSDRDKRFGVTGQKPISYNVGDLAWSLHYKPPSHGGKSEVKNFYDKSHLNVTL
jgi:hypothetical protein